MKAGADKPALPRWPLLCAEGRRACCMQASPPLMLGPKHIKLLATRPRRLSCGMIHFITRITRASMPHAGQAETRDSTPGNPQAALLLLCHGTRAVIHSPRSSSQASSRSQSRVGVLAFQMCQHDSEEIVEYSSGTFCCDRISTEPERRPTLLSCQRQEHEATRMLH